MSSHNNWNGHTGTSYLSFAHEVLEGGAQFDRAAQQLLGTQFPLQPTLVSRLEEVHQVVEVDLKVLEVLEDGHDAHALAVLKVGGRVDGSVVRVAVLQCTPHLVVRYSGMLIVTRKFNS